MLFNMFWSIALQHFATILIFIPCANLQGCDGNHGCCSGSVWNETSQICSPCMDGYVGLNCEKTCLYPKYGFRCQHICNCNQTNCNFSIGCPLPQTADIPNGTYSNGETQSIYSSSGSTTVFRKRERHLKNNIVSLSALVVSCSLIFIVIVYVICRTLKSKGRGSFRHPSEDTGDIPQANENHYSEIKETNMVTQIDMKM
ncbi:uncharacterized protein LOC134250843 isoform X2 [Saccostrea cucullata]|uniref:uncharacterized protein LOC134250843 isoform X2 n=1 Tax=Saccostrea cuccullata TaxID=36930 RepID=UPI002ED12E13